MTTALEGGEGSASRPGRSLPPGKTRYPLYRRLGGPQGRCGQVRKISPPPGFDPRTVQTVASRYTDWATRPIIQSVIIPFSSSELKRPGHEPGHSQWFRTREHVGLPQVPRYVFMATSLRKLKDKLSLTVSITPFWTSVWVTLFYLRGLTLTPHLLLEPLVMKE